MTASTDLIESMWEEVDVCEVDTATLAFTDGRVAADHRGKDHLQWSDSWMELGTIGGYPCAAWWTGEDLSVPIEVQRDVEGSVIAVRAEVVNDIPDLDGVWNDVAELPFPTGQVFVCDPVCSSDRHWRALAVKPGIYQHQVFTYAGEPLGMRIIWLRAD